MHVLRVGVTRAAEPHRIASISDIPDIKRGFVEIEQDFAVGRGIYTLRIFATVGDHHRRGIVHVITAAGTGHHFKGRRLRVADRIRTIRAGIPIRPGDNQCWQIAIHRQAGAKVGIGGIHIVRGREVTGICTLLNSVWQIAQVDNEQPIAGTIGCDVSVGIPTAR